MIFRKYIPCSKSIHFGLNSREISLEELHMFLSHYKGFMLALLENPQLFEHDRFTDLLHAVFHLAEELNARERLIDLPTTDYNHLSGDLTRVYSQLVIEWLEYMQHLKKKYPYLFSLSMRMNPFDYKRIGDHTRITNRSYTVQSGFANINALSGINSL